MFVSFEAVKVWASYFARKHDKTGHVVGYLNEIKTAKDQEMARNDYSLIMRDKERLPTF